MFRRLISLAAFSVLLESGAMGGAQSCGMHPVCVRGLWGYVATNGEERIAPQFSNALYFSEEVAAAKQGSLWGYINSKGEWVIPPRYHVAFSFTEAFATVAMDGQYGYIDRQGILVIPTIYQHASYFREGIAPVCRIENGKRLWFYVDNRGIPASHELFEGAWTLSNGRGRVLIGGRYGYADRDGAVVIVPRYDSARDFSEGLAAVNLGAVAGFGGRWGFIDAEGKVAIGIQFVAAHCFSDGLAAVQREGMGDGRTKQGNTLPPLWGFVDASGAEVLAPRWDEVGSFSENLAPARRKGKWGYIDKQGEWAIAPRFSQARDFFCGLAYVVVGDEFSFGGKKAGYIRSNGDWVWRTPGRETQNGTTTRMYNSSEAEAYAVATAIENGRDLQYFEEPISTYDDESDVWHVFFHGKGPQRRNNFAVILDAAAGTVTLFSGMARPQESTPE